MVGVFIKRGNLDTEIGTEGRRCEDTGRMPCEHEDGHLQAKEGGLDRPFPHSTQKEPPLPTL